MNATDVDYLVAQRRYSLARTAAIAMLTLVIIAFSGLMLFLVVGIQHAQQGITGCTKPGGPCYERQLYTVKVAQLNARNIIRVCMQSHAACESLPAPPLESR